MLVKGGPGIKSSFRSKAAAGFKYIEYSELVSSIKAAPLLRYLFNGNPFIRKGGLYGRNVPMRIWSNDMNIYWLIAIQMISLTRDSP